MNNSAMKNLITLIFILNTSLFLSGQQNTFINWSFETKGKIMSHPVIDKNNIYFGSSDSIFYAVDIATGNQLWNFKTNSEIRSKAIIFNDLVYFKSGNDIYAINKFDGKQKWVVACEDKKGATAIDLWDYHSGAPAIHNSTIYFGLGNGKITGCDLYSGNIKTEIIIKDSAAIKSGLLVDNSILYFGDWEGRLHAYDLFTGKQLWVYNTYEKKLYETFGQINTQLSLSGNLLFFGGRNPELQVLDKNTGEKQWSYVEKDGGWISGDPLLQNDTLFIGGSDNHEMMAFNAKTGEKYWTYLFLNNNFSKPLSYGNYLLFTTGDAYNVYGSSNGRGYLYALNKADGTIENFAKIGGNIYSSLVAQGDVLYMGSEDGMLYSVDLVTFLNDTTPLKAKGYNSVEINNASLLGFTDTLDIQYKLNYNTHINVYVKDLNEEVVKKLFSGEKNEGQHTIVWNAKDAAGNIVNDGYYFFEIESGEYYQKIIIQKKPENIDN